MNSPVVAWSVAARLGEALVPAGPVLPAGDAEAIVADLRAGADAADHLVAEVTHLDGGLPVRVLVVDRPTWIGYNVDLASGLMGTTDTPSLVDQVTGAVAGVQLGIGLHLVAQRVLGQFDPFSDVPTLLLVAPNAAQVADSLGVDGHAFRMWVCLHEVTHRYQFGHAPWLADHLRSLIRRIVGAESAPLSGWRPGKPLPRTLVDLVLGPDGREAFDEAGAVMALMEGHADFMMDRTDAVPGVAAIRAKFQARREAGGLDAVIRAVTGLDAKHAQYRDGAAFCRRVVSAVGVAGLNRAFESAALLPTRSEIADPDLWVARTRRSS